MWKLLLFAVIAVGTSASDNLRRIIEQNERYQIQGRALECAKYGACERKDEIGAAILDAIACQRAIFGDGGTRRNTDPMETVRKICEQRDLFRQCAHFFIEEIAPSSSPSVQAQVKELKGAITELVSFVCDDDYARVRHFNEDGGFQCFVEKNVRLSRCTNNINDLVNDLPMPEDTKTLGAVDACHRLDEMESCMLNILDECPKPSTKEFVNQILSIARRGTFCHITLPVTEDVNVNKTGV